MHFDIRIASWLHESRDDGIATSLGYPWTHFQTLGLKMIIIGIRFFAFILATRVKKR